MQSPGTESPNDVQRQSNTPAVYGSRKKIGYYLFMAIISVIPVIGGAIIGANIDTEKYRIRIRLIFLSGIASVLVWHYGKGLNSDTWNALVLYVIQLIVNFAWSPVFFNAGYMAGALVVIAALWSLILSTILAFWRISKMSAILLLPYLAWVSFATALNYAEVCLNGCTFDDNWSINNNATLKNDTLIDIVDIN